MGDERYSFAPASSPTQPPAILTRTLSYSDLDTPLTGVLHWNEGQPGPGILLIHGGAGLDEHA
jgi:hypothetical protein